MRSDWDDAPRRSRKGGGAPNWLFVGVAIALVLVFGSRGEWEILRSGLPWWFSETTTPIRTGSEPDAPSGLPHQAAAPQQTAEELFWEQERARQQVSLARQTDFNDSNYTPSREINVVSFAGSRRPAEQPARPPTIRADRPRGSSPALVVWKDARGRSTGWHTSFNYRNGVIDNASFCLNLGKGSIEYRNCRKGAKEWLKDQCRSSRALSSEWRDMYCHAHSAYRT